MHCEDEVIRRSAFQGFDDAIVGTAGDDAEAIAGYVGGLMVGRVHGDGELAALRG